MNPEQSNLRQQQHAEQEQASEQSQATNQQAEAKEFATVDDLLRYDSDQNPVPPQVAERLGESVEAEPKPQVPWFKKLFG